MTLLPGIAATLFAVLAATVLAELVPAIPLLTAAVVIGIVVGQLPGFRILLDGVLGPGIRFASKTLMRIGIVLLGLEVSLIDIADLGWLSIIAIVGLVVVTFFVTWGFGRAMGLPGQEPLLVAAGFSICGASAIGAMAGATRARASEQATPVALVTLCGTLAIAVLPALQAPLGLSNDQFGHWVGAGVHDVGQVVATAQTAGAAALAIAVVVKLTRVLMLAPMVAAASIATRRADAAAAARADRAAAASARSTTAASRTAAAASGKTAAEDEGRPPIVPVFVIGFVAAVLLNSFVLVPGAVLGTADLVRDLLLAAALFALGTGVRVGKLLRTGWRALIVGLGSWLFIAVLAYGIAVS